MDSLHRLEEVFARFPGIGPRQAKRFVYYLLSKPASFTSEFIRLIEAVKRSTTECSSCGMIFIDGQKDEALCSICSDEHRDHSLLMIVARDTDLESIEKSNAYAGLYFILGGTVPILDKEPEKRIRLEKLLRRVAELKGLKEVILSLNTTPDGEHTAEIVRRAFTNSMNGRSLMITVLGRGLSTGAELEYTDGETIKSALKHRE